VTAVSPLTKTARQARIAAVLTQSQVRSQEELAAILAEHGIRVTQATLSRDLDELGAVRLRGPEGALMYALPGEPGGPGSRPGAAALAPVPPADSPAAAVPSAAPGGPAAGEVAASRAAAPSAAAAVRAAPAVPAAGASGGRSGTRVVSGGASVLGTLPRVAGELLVSAEASANLVVLRTPAGGAQLLASAIDHAGWPAILGTVAGDDTVLVITRDPAGGGDVAAALLRLAERRTP